MTYEEKELLLKLLYELIFLIENPGSNPEEARDYYARLVLLHGKDVKP